jgi:hypothetical protein
MVKKQQIDPQPQTLQPTSQLDRFSIVFEYDKTLQEVRRDVRIRTHKAA